MAVLRRKQYFSKDPEVSIIFQGGSNIFQGGGGGGGVPNANFYRNPYNL